MQLRAKSKKIVSLIGGFFSLTAAFSALSSAVEVPVDPYLWLEEVEGKKALSWVQKHNQSTAKYMESRPEFKKIHSDIKSIFFSQDRVPFSWFSHGYFWNFWDDEKHEKGVLRRTSAEEYRKANPRWEVILDFDQLSESENEDWVFQDMDRLGDGTTRFLLSLSRGGKDASVVREFDYEKKEFISDGFNVPEAKTSISVLDKDTLLIGTDFGPGSLTDSGDPRIIKLWKRGQPLSEARTVFEGEVSDVAAEATVFRDGDQKHVVFEKVLEFFRHKRFLQETSGSLRELPIPETARLVSIKGGFMYLKLSEQYQKGGRTIPTDSVVRARLDATSLEDAELIFTAEGRRSIEEVKEKGGVLYIETLNNIRGEVIKATRAQNGTWEISELPFPKTGCISLSIGSEADPTAKILMTYTDILTPLSQYEVVAGPHGYRLELLKKGKEWFDPGRYEAVQNFATSRDGTQIPYFIAKPKNLPLNSTNPTLLYGYGGFEISLTPEYSAKIGKLWLERGGVFVMANIRGGGEFGPEWHKAAIKENRQKAFDDFAAVAEDLIARRVTSPAHLGIIGGSNGGLLTGVTLVQRPDLMKAAVIQVPLLDMVRFSQLLAGASWMGEYGDPSKPEELEYLLKYSPYHNVKAGVHYPKPFFTTSTKDDRVHPSHARKMAARMEEQGHPFFYFENTKGGHTGSAGPTEEAYVTALEFTYLWDQLGVH